MIWQPRSVPSLKTWHLSTSWSTGWRPPQPSIKITPSEAGPGPGCLYFHGDAAHPACRKTNIEKYLLYSYHQDSICNFECHIYLLLMPLKTPYKLTATEKKKTTLNNCLLLFFFVFESLTDINNSDISFNIKMYESWLYACFFIIIINGGISVDITNIWFCFFSDEIQLYGM